MERIKTNDDGRSIWLIEYQKMIKWIQDVMIENLRKFLRKLFITPGVLFYGSQTMLKCSAVINGDYIDVTIQPGTALTGRGDYIVIPETILYKVPYAGVNIFRSIYLRYKPVDDTDPTYEVVRQPLTFPSINVHEMDSYEVKNVDYSGWPPPGEIAGDCIAIGWVQVLSGNLTVTDKRVQAEYFNIPAAAINWINTNYNQITKDWTTASEFRVGYGTLNNGAGIKLLTEPEYNPGKPLNIRIYDIKPIKSKCLEQVVRVDFKWNWEQLIGEHNGGDGDNTIRITGVGGGEPALNVAEDALIGYYLYDDGFLSETKMYRIVQNTATANNITVLTLSGGYQNEAASSAMVLCYADKMEVVIAPQIDGNADYTRAYVRKLPDWYTNTLRFNIELPMINSTGTQAKYYVKMRSGAYNKASEFGDMAPGQYDPNHDGKDLISYTIPFECNLPPLDDTGAAINLTRTTSGFEISVDGWYGDDPDDQYHQLEFRISSDKNGEIDWSDTTLEWLTSSSGKVIISRNNPQWWKVGVRPLQNGRPVGTPKYGLIYGGSVQPALTYVPIFNVPINLNTYSGTLTGYSVPDMLYDLTNVMFPADGSSLENAENYDTAIQYLIRNQSYLTDNAGVVYKILRRECHRVAGQLRLRLMLKKLSSSDPNPTTGAASVNTSRIGRKIASLSSPPQSNKRITHFIYDSSEIVGATIDNPAVARLYVSDNEPLAKYFEMWQDNWHEEFELTNMLEYPAGKVLTLDMFDDSENGNNKAAIVGTIQVFGIEATQ